MENTQQKEKLEQRILRLLSLNGYAEVDKVDLENADLKLWESMADDPLVKSYVQRDNLVIKKAYLQILKEIYEEGLKGNFKVNFTNLSKKVKLDYYLTTIPVYYYHNILKKDHMIQWLPSFSPKWEHALEVYDIYDKMRAYELSEETKKYVRENFKKGFDDLNALLNPEKHPGKHYKIKREVLYQTSALNKKEKQVSDLISASRMLSRNLSNSVNGGKVNTPAPAPPPAQTEIKPKAEDIKAVKQTPAPPPDEQTQENPTGEIKAQIELNGDAKALRAVVQSLKLQLEMYEKKIQSNQENIWAMERALVSTH